MFIYFGKEPCTTAHTHTVSQAINATALEQIEQHFKCSGLIESASTAARKQIRFGSKMMCACVSVCV